MLTTMFQHLYTAGEQKADWPLLSLHTQYIY